MASRVTRRDILNGVVIGTGVGLLAPHDVLALDAESTAVRSNPVLRPNLEPAYPPTLTGMRGSHEGSYEVAHALAWEGRKPARYEPLDEHYDLVVVGGGMSGLAAAWFYQKKTGPDARVLILDNHDDFGGHAKRNEFHHEGRMVLSLGGAQNLDSPSNYSETAGSLMRDLGIDQEAIDAMDAETPDNYLLGGKWHGNVGMSIPSPTNTKAGHTTVGGHWYKFMHGRGEYVSAVRELPIPEYRAG